MDSLDAPNAGNSQTERVTSILPSHPSVVWLREQPIRTVKELVRKLKADHVLFHNRTARRSSYFRNLTLNAVVIAVDKGEIYDASRILDAGTEQQNG